MISTSQKYKQELIKGNRNYVVKVEMTLADTTFLTLTNETIWEQGVVLSQAISSDDTFDIGSAIVGSLKIVIDNISGAYNTYDFMDAHLTLWLGVENDVDLGGNQIFYRIGVYVVDDTSYNGSLITLDCLDNMTWFDVPFSDVGFPTSSNTTAGQLVSAICSYVGVTLGKVDFPKYTTTIYRQSLLNLEENNYNCREILQFVAQKCCCYCKVNTLGELILKWHDKNEIIGIQGYDGGTFSTHTTPYSDGDAVDGKLFNPWEQGINYDGGTFADLQDSVWLSHNFDISVSTEEIVVTGCVIRSSLGQEDDHYDVIWVDTDLEETKPRYALVIENNPLILKAEADTVANSVGNVLAYLPVRAFESRSLSDFSCETGDMATIVDFRGNVYYSWITHFTFTINNAESFGCGVQSIRKRNESRFSTSVQTLLNAEKSLSDYDKAVKALNELGQSAVGYKEYFYPSEATALDSRVTYRYNGTTIDTTIPSKPKFSDSTVVFKISGDGVFISRSTDSQGYPVFDNGYDANSGTAILDLLYAQGISCSVIKSGRLSLGGSNQSIYKNGELYVYGSNNAEVGHWTRDGISVKTGTITLGNKTSLTDNNTGVYIGSDGMALGANPTFKVTNAGELTAKSGYIGNGSSGWTIANTAIYNGCSSITSNTNGTYVGTNGLRNKSGNNVVTITGGGITANSGSLGGIAINANGLGTGGSGTNNNAIHLNDGDIGISTETDSSWGGLAFGKEAADRTSWARSCCVLWNGGESGAGFHVISGSPNQGNTGNFSALKQSSLQLWKNNNLAGEYAQGGFYPPSDRRLKKKIKSLGQNKIRKFFKLLNPVSFIFKDTPDETRYGVIAQELEEVLEECGFNNSVFIKEQGTKKHYKSVNYTEFTGLSLAGIKHLFEIVDNQQKEINLLKKEIAELKARVN